MVPITGTRSPTSQISESQQEFPTLGKSPSILCFREGKETVRLSQRGRKSQEVGHLTCLSEEYINLPRASFSCLSVCLAKICLTPGRSWQSGQSTDNDCLHIGVDVKPVDAQSTRLGAFPAPIQPSQGFLWRHSSLVHTGRPEKLDSDVNKE